MRDQYIAGMPDRRQWLRKTAVAVAHGALTTHAAQSELVTRAAAEHCIMIWLGGGMAQIDTFDPKEMGDPKSKKAGSYYPAIDTSVPGVRVCQHLHRTARVMDHVTAIRSLHHDVIDEHAAATNRMHTGRHTTGTVQYPSLGSIVAHQRGAAERGVPSYVLLGYPNLTRGPGFLPQSAGFVYATDTDSPPLGLARPKAISSTRQARRELLLAATRQATREKWRDDRLLAGYDEALATNLRLGRPGFQRVFDLEEEADALREQYGDHFGQRCLLARRVCEAGVRFVEVSHNMNFRNGTGWDTHNDGQLNQHLLIEELDQALHALITDLAARRMLEKSLIVVNTEFGRPAEFDSGGGRGHHGRCFSVVLAGGGLRHQGAIGVTNHLAMEIVERPVSVPDLFATILTTLQIDPHAVVYNGDRPVTLTDGGRPIMELLT